MFKACLNFRNLYVFRFTLDQFAGGTAFQPFLPSNELAWMTETCLITGRQIAVNASQFERINLPDHHGL